MKIQKLLFNSLFMAILIFFSSCNKEEGYGGNSSIKGVLVEKFYNDDYSQLIYEKKAADEDIYILFNKSGTISDKVSTTYDGKFEFKYLFPGKYQIYFYSDDTTSAYFENKEFVMDIDLKKNEELDLGQLAKINTVDYNEGSASIKGKVFLINYLNSSSYPNLIVKDITLAQDHEVYLIYGKHPSYDERIRTNYDGTFTFRNLIKGKYKIYLYSEDIRGGTQDIVILKEIEIVNEFDVINLGDIYVEQL